MLYTVCRLQVVKQTLIDKKPLKREILNTAYWATQIIASSSQTNPNPGKWLAQDATSKKCLPMVAVGALLWQVWWCILAALMAVFSTPLGAWMEETARWSWLEVKPKGRFIGLNRMSSIKYPDI